MNSSFQCSFTSKEPANEVFDKINRVSEWWTINIIGESKRAGDIFKSDFDETWATMQISESIPGNKVVWHVRDCNLHFIHDKKEWKDTNIIFEIIPKNGETELHFTHEGLVPEVECYGKCEQGWNFYIKTSLANFINEGKGNPDTMDLSKKKSEIKRRNPRAVADVEKGVVLASAELVLSPSRVFRALTRPDEIEVWWGSNDTYRMREWKADLQPGGNYTVVVTLPNGATHPASGSFIDIEPSHKLSHTRKYNWDHPTLGQQETIITYLLDPIEIGTRITVRHEGFSGFPDAAFEHADGWERVLGWLDHYIYYNYYFPKGELGA